MNCFALMWSDFARDKLIAAVDKVPEIVNWRASSGAIFLVSEESDNWLAEKIHEIVPELKTFLVTKIDMEHAQGYQDKQTWDFIQNPRAVGKK